MSVVLAWLANVVCIVRLVLVLSRVASLREEYSNGEVLVVPRKKSKEQFHKTVNIGNS